MKEELFEGKIVNNVKLLRQHKCEKINGEKVWVCKCLLCEKIFKVVGSKLRAKITKSCGCLRKRGGVDHPNFKDITGQKFGMLTVLRVYHIGGRRTYWKCKCDCGNETSVVVDKLTSGKTRSCGCLKNRKGIDNPCFINLKNKRFGRLTVLEFFENRNSKNYWKCKCDCGNIVNVNVVKLINGHTRSCGCLLKEVMTIHGDSKSKFYNIWEDMKSRCDNEKHVFYKNYGGRGIIYDPKWGKYEGFKEEMKLKYLYAKYQLKIENPTIERKNVNKNYCKENCNFIDPKYQMSNTRRNKWFKAYSPDGKVYMSKVVSKFAEEHGLTEQSVYRCLFGKRKHHRGWKFIPLEDRREL